jgi:MFS family permease
MAKLAGRQFTYGWVVVGSVALLLMASSGTRFGLGVVFKPMVDYFGISRGELALAVSIQVLVSALSQPFVGMLVDRYGTRRVSGVGMLIVAAGLIGVSFAQNVWHVYVFYGIIASLGFAATGPASTAKIVTQWFAKRRPLAMSISHIGTTMGQFIVIPLIALVLISFNWQWSFRFLAILIIAVTSPLWWRLVRSPRPDEREEKTGGAADTYKIPLRRALTSSPFWLLAVGYFVCGFTMSFASTHIIAFADDMHIPQVAASTAVGVMSIFGVTGSIIMGYFADRTGRKNMLAFVYFLRGIAFFLLLFVNSEIGLFAVAVVLGTSWMANTSLTASITADIYGTTAMGTLYGTLFATMPLGSAVGSAAGGFIHDLTGTYDAALWLSASLGFIACIASLLVRSEPVPELQEARAAQRSGLATEGSAAG